MKPLDKILEKMCSMVGAEKDLIDFKNPYWYDLFKWTEAQQNEFKEWLIDFFLNDKEARHELLERPAKNLKFIKMAVDEFIFNYGWTME
jgi:hypothetical protein